MVEEKTRVKMFKAVYTAFIGFLILLLLALVTLVLGSFGLLLYVAWTEKFLTPLIGVFFLSVLPIYLWFKFNEWGYKAQKEIRKKDKEEMTWIEIRIDQTKFEQQVEEWEGMKAYWRSKLKNGGKNQERGMKVVVAGSRSISDYQLVAHVIEESGFEVTEIVSGTAKGVDKMGEAYAKENDIPVKRFPADWEEHGRSAGAIRNEEMAEYADALVAVWDGESRGTQIMLDKAENHGLKIHKETKTT